MQKRGQVTLFIVLGIIIVAIIGIGLYFRGEIFGNIEAAKLAEREALSQEEMAVAGQIDDCVDNVLERGVVQVARNGGYYPPIKGSTPYLGFNIPLYYDKGKENLPDAGTLGEGIAWFVDENLEECLRDVTVIKKPSTEVTIGRTVKANVRMTVKVKDAKLSRFSGETGVDVEKYLDDTLEFYQLAKKYNATVDALALGRYVVDRGFKYSYDSFDNKSLFFVIWDDVIRDKPYIFSFGVRKDFIAEDEDIFTEPAQGAIGEDAEEVPDELLNQTLEPGSLNLSDPEDLAFLDEVHQTIEEL